MIAIEQVELKPAPIPPIICAIKLSKMNHNLLYMKANDPKISNCRTTERSPRIRPRVLPIWFKNLPVIREAKMYTTAKTPIINPK